MFRWMSISLFILVIIIGLVGCGQTDSNKTNSTTDSKSESNEVKARDDAIVLKSSIQSPPDAPFSRGFDIYLDKIEEKSDGKIKFERYYSESLAKAAEQFDAIGSGVADIAVVSTSYIPGKVPLANVGSNPALWGDVWVGETALRELYESVPAMREETEAQNVKWVGQYATASYYVISTKPVRSLDDIKGLKTIATGELAELAANLGATTVGIPVTETYEALDRGTVDATIQGLAGATTYGVDEVAKYIYKLPMGSATGLYGMNLDTWDGLSEELQDIIREVNAEHPADFHEIYQVEGDGDSIAKFEASGTEFIEPTEDDAKQLQKIAQPLWDKWIEENEKKGLPAKEVFDTFKELIEKYEKENPFSE